VNEKTEIEALKMVRRIRDELTEELKGKSRSEIIDFYVNAGELARQETKRHRERQLHTESSR
jgi:hypothetical protein